MATQSAVVGRRVLADLIPASAKATTLARDAVLVLGGAGLVGLSAQVAVEIPAISPVPFVATTLTALLLGAAYGPVRAALTFSLYLLAGMAGVPWFTDGNSGTGIVSLGYVIGFLAAGVVVGELARRGGDRTPLRTIGTMIIGNLVIYAFGVPYLIAASGMDISTGLYKGAAVFLVGDLIKLAIAAALLPGAWALVKKFRDA
ncbi:biotin transporter BioY [Phytomonospora sp. NPDC050363]|uniref:biotin transporter BioY n=1 Tax=Phytomonospora sp. NPDC050363 TaxID=3155642 RepID=UPI0033CD1368